MKHQPSQVQIPPKPPISPKRRFFTALFGSKPDRLPVGNVVSVATVELMEIADAWFPQAHLDAETMARLAVTGHEVLGYDTVMPVFSVTQEAAALKCVVDWGHPEMMPAVRTHPFLSQVNVETAVEVTSGKMTLRNINNPETLLFGTPEQVATACHQAVQGGIHILAPECAVPLRTPLRNLQTLVDVARGAA